MNTQKSVFTIILLGLSVLLLTLPFFVSFNNLLTRFVEHNMLYSFIQQTVVPWEAKLMGAMLMPLGYDYAVAKNGTGIVVNGLFMGLTWNCLGWQSFLLFLVTLVSVLKGNYTKRSLLQAVAIGVLGTFWLNIFRMLFTILLAVHVPPLFQIVFHDYLAALSTIAWLFLFWWFSYAYVLEEIGGQSSFSAQKR